MKYKNTKGAETKSYQTGQEFRHGREVYSLNL